MNKILIQSGSEGWMHTSMKNQMWSLQFNWEGNFLFTWVLHVSMQKKILMEEWTQE